MASTSVIQMPGRCRLVLPETATVDQWLHARTTGIGGSEVAALFGVSPYATAFDVFKAKVGSDGKPRFLGAQPVTGPRIRPELLTEDPILEWGHRLEDAVALKTADQLGLVARPGGGLWQHVDHPLAIVTPDRVATKRRSRRPLALIECKTSSDDWEDGEAPIQYQIQAQWQMGITGLSPCYLGCFVLGHDRAFHVVRIDFDAEWFAEMVGIAEKFWAEHVLTGEPPMHDLAHPRTTDLLKELHPHVVLEATELPSDEGVEWIEAYHRAKAEADAAGQRLEEAKNWLKVQLGDAGAAYLNGQKVASYPEVQTSRVSTKRLREDYPEIAEKCSETTTHRRLTVRRIKPAQIN